MGLAVKKVSSRRRGPIRDTSARKGATPTLSKEYQAVFETTGKAMVIIEEDATISLANAEFEKLSGYTKEEIEGKKNWTEFVARDDRKRVKEYHLLRRTDPMLAPRSFEFRFLDRQDKVKNIILTIGQIPGTNKSMASLLDVTDRRQAEETVQRDKKTLEDRVEGQTTELVRANEALQTEIADLKREVKRLRQSEAHNRTLIDNIDLAINLIDADHNIVMVNAAGSKQTNKPVSELIGKKCFREFEKRDAVCPHCPGVQTIATGKLAEVETEGVRDDGSRYNVRIQTFPVFGHDGTTTGFIEIGEDITERKRIEEELQESEERFRTLVETMKVGLSAVDAKGVHTYVNEHLSEMWGYSVDEIMGRPVVDFLDEGNRKILKKQSPTRRKGEREAYEITWTRKDGSRVPTILSPTPIFDTEGRFKGSYGFITDITERKRAEELLRQEKETFSTILQHALYGVALMDRDGKHVYVNPEFVAITGYTLEDIPTGKDWMHKAYPDKAYRQKVTECWRKDSELGGTRRVVSVVCKDGETKEIETGRTPLENGLSVVMLTDITERKQMAEKLRESEERYRSLIENINLGINLIDADHNILMTNAAQGKQFNKPVSEMIGKKCFREFEKRDAMCPHCPGVQTMATGKPAEVETQGVRDDGSLYYARIQAFPVFGHDGTVSAIIETSEDITERKQMEEDLRENEERFKMLAEHAPLGISIMAPDRSFDYLNPRFTEIFGYTTEDIPDKDTWFKKAYPDEAYRKKLISTWKQDTAEALKIGKENQRVFTVRCKNGQDKIIDFRRIDLKDGKQYQIYDDITDRAKAEEALKQSEERYRALVENVNLGINLIDTDHNILMINAGQSSHFGKPRSETIDKKCFREFEKRDTVCPHCPGVQTMATGQPAEAETVGIRDDGSRFNARLQTFPIFGQDGTVTSFIEVVEDITERKKMEETLQSAYDELKESETRYRTLVDNVDLGINLIDINHTIVLVNAAESKHFNKPASDFIGKKCFREFERRDAVCPHCPGVQAIATGKPAEVETVGVRDDGSQYTVRIQAFPIFGHDGQVTGFIEITENITERKRAEERLKRYAVELERSNEEVKNFAYIVSHDLRVPLINLKGYTSELRSALEVISPTMETALPHLNEDKRSAAAIALHEDVPEALEFITNSVTRMDSFINSVLILSRLGRRELKPEPIDMNALVQTSLENLSHQIQARGTTVTVESLPQVVADRTAIEQIMGNILGNAVKYLDPERPGQIGVTAQNNNGEQLFRIRDNGRGVAQEDMHKVFAPFRRAGKQDTQGEGMGLAYVQTLVRRHNGRIWCESELGKGTTFTFTISQHRVEGEDHVAN